MIPLRTQYRLARPNGLTIPACICLLACLSLAVWLCLYGADTKQASVSTTGVPDSADSRAQCLVPAAASAPQYRPIEQLRVGQGVVTPGTRATESLPTEVDPATWKALTLQVERPWPDGTADTIAVQTLQPQAWLILHEAHVGGYVPIPLDLREMGLPPMSAQVMAIEPCPPIGQGPGRVVLTTVNHLNHFLFDLKVNGKRGPPQLLQVTGWHKLYSEDRGAWTSVCELHPGEVLRGREGPLRVASLVRHPGTVRVYNLTVENEHQYYVSAEDLLAHNAGCVGRTLADDLPRDKGGRTIVPSSEAEGYAHTVLGTRTEPTISPEPYTQGVTFDENGNPLGRTDVTDHGRGDHVNPHYHPWNGSKFTNPSQPIPEWTDRPAGW